MENKHLILLGAVVLAVILVVLLIIPSSSKSQDALNSGLGNPFGFGSNSTPLTPSIAPTPITELQGEDIAVGTGSAAVAAGDTITVNYIGALADGKVFDNSYERKSPFTFQVGTGKIIQGFERGVIGMKLGGKRKLLIPSSLGYGNKAQGSIPANSALIFQIELINIVPPNTPTPEASPTESPTPTPGP
ncbi:MAG: FKBP-type peptidyl-prolyl cis-trans isomerase [Patescibacteria group bacterium]